MPQQSLLVVTRSASYQPASSSPFDHATGLFASEDIEQLYALPQGAHPGRLRHSEDYGTGQQGTGHLAALGINGSAASSPTYLSCSSGSDTNDSPDVHTTADQHHDGSEAQLYPGSSTVSNSAVSRTMRSSDVRAFWVPDLAGQSEYFTEDTKQQFEQIATASPSKSFTMPVPNDESEVSAAASVLLGNRQQSLAQAWASPQVTAATTVAGSFSSSQDGSFSMEGGPHPPLAPSPHATLDHATSGFRGGVREDPRLRRFREASDIESQTSVLTHSLQSSRRQPSSCAADQQGTQLPDHHGMGHLNRQAVGTGASLQTLHVAETASEQQAVRESEQGPEGKQYLRAAPSLAWAASPAETQSSPGENMSWAEYCSDSDESATSGVSKHTQHTARVVRRRSSH